MADFLLNSEILNYLLQTFFLRGKNIYKKPEIYCSLYGSN